MRVIIGLLILLALCMPANADTGHEGYTNNIDIVIYRAGYDGIECDIDNAVIDVVPEIRLEYWGSDENERYTLVGNGEVSTVVDGDIDFAYGVSFPAIGYQPCPNLRRARLIVEVDGGITHVYKSYYYVAESIGDSFSLYLPAIYNSCERCVTIPRPIVRPSTPIPERASDG